MNKRITRQVAAAISAALVNLPACALAARVLEKDGVEIGWSSVTQIQLELFHEYPEELSSGVMQAQTLEAMQLWNAQRTCNAPILTLTGESSSSPQSGDGKNTIAWVRSGWVATTGSTAESPGVTDIRIGQDAVGTYRIVETDIYLNAESFSWTAERTTAGLVSNPWLQYVEEVLAHELGHVLGLDHPCEFEPPATVPDCTSGWYGNTLMFPNPRYVEPTLAGDDVAGLCDLYHVPSCAGTTTECTPRPNDSTAASTVPILAPEDAICTKHEQCQPGLACIQNLCTHGSYAPGDSCNVDAQCASEHCINGGCREGCSTESSCQFAQQECDLETSTCAANLGIFGDACTSPNECTSGRCLFEIGHESYCTKECVSTSDCPIGLNCTAVDGIRVCRYPDYTSRGCALFKPSRGAETFWGVLALGLMFVLRIQRLRGKSEY